MIEVWRSVSSTIYTLSHCADNICGVTTKLKTLREGV